MSVNITLYRFSELDEKAQEKAVVAVRDTNDNQPDDWYETYYEDCEDLIAPFGFEDPDFSFSHLHCQGAGASFTANVDWQKFVTANKMRSRVRRLLREQNKGNLDVTIKIRRMSSGYNHSMTMTTDAELYYHNIASGKQGPYEEEYDELVRAVLEKAREFANDLYHRLDNADMDYYDEGNVREYLEANEHIYLFFEDGSLADDDADDYDDEDLDDEE